MILISHRRNLLSELVTTPVEYGIEVDIRSQGQDLVIHHDPFVMGNSFEEWIAAYQHQMLILNVKEEGLENRLLILMKKYGIKDFFFLDQSFPFLIKTARTGERRCAVRVSEFESVDTAMSLAGKIDWVWVDCFTRFPLDASSANRLTESGFRLCLVSPELQGRTDPAEITSLRSYLAAEGIKADAVCTKVPQFWI